MERRKFIKGALAAFGIGATLGVSTLLPKETQPKIGCAEIPSREDALKQVGAFASGSGASFEEANEALATMTRNGAIEIERFNEAARKLAEAFDAGARANVEAFGKLQRNIRTLANAQA